MDFRPAIDLRGGAIDLRGGAMDLRGGAMDLRGGPDMDFLGPAPPNDLRGFPGLKLFDFRGPSVRGKRKRNSGIK